MVESEFTNYTLLMPDRKTPFQQLTKEVFSSLKKDKMKKSPLQCF